MTFSRVCLSGLLLAAGGVVVAAWLQQTDEARRVPPDREEVVFWHFWGGEDRDVVEDVVARFNASQDQYFVRAVAMPGNNLDVKLFLAVTGGDPPDVVNQDDPIVADWAARGALTPLEDLATPDEIERLREWLFPAALRLCEYDGKMYGMCNGLDVRALYYNKTLLDEHGLAPPRSLAELDDISRALTVVDRQGQIQRIGYLPDSRRLWAWGVVFGGDFYDERTGEVTADAKPIVRALDWMASYSRRLGADQVAAFRTGDQSLPGKAFPLLPSGDSPHGRYGAIMDGQWRVRDILASRASRRAVGLPVAEYGVCPLPPPPGGRERAGWVNGNFFVVPRGAKNRAGAWEFMRFWSGFDGRESAAARTCVAGGWIPVSARVVEQPEFQQYLRERPLFAEFVALAGSPNQFPVPVIPGAPLFNREIKNVGGQAMSQIDASPRELLEGATRRIQQHLDRLREREHAP